MKITFPHQRKKITLSRNCGIIYVLLAKGSMSRYWLQNFWPMLPKSFETYKEAKEGKKILDHHLKDNGWDEFDKDYKCVIAKIVL